MQLTRQTIDAYSTKFPEFQYYHKILDKIDENAVEMPDVSIESCKSLVEGISKTILIKLKVPYSEKDRNADTPRDLWKKVLDNLPVSTSYDSEFVSRTCALVTRITEIRNKRGDISHGRPSPKEIESDVRLSGFIAQVTDSLVSYLLETYFSLDLSYLEKINYEDEIEFNQSLDDIYPIDGVISYSKALYDQDQVSYEEQLLNYKSQREAANESERKGKL